MGENIVKASFKDTIKETGLPIVSFYQNNKRFDFIIDTGAEYSVVNSDSLNDLVYIKLEENGIIYGIEGNKKETLSIGVILYIGDNEFTEVFQVTDIPGINIVNDLYDTNIIGILGNQFLLRYKFIINYEELYVYGESDKTSNT